MENNLATFLDGPPRCGKSYLGKCLSANHLRQGNKVLVYDPVGAKDWPCTWKTSSGKNVLDFFTARLPDGTCKNRGFVAFLDEVETIFTPPYSAWKPGPFSHISTRSAGHNDAIVYFLAQRFTQVPPAWRENVTRLALFPVTIKRARYWAEVFQDDDIERLMKGLPQYHFLWKESGKKVRRCVSVSC